MPATGAMVELLLGSTWTDITDRAYLRDRIRITRGRQDQGGRVDPGSCSITLNNKDGRFSPRNPVGPYYGQIGRGTPVRVSARAGSAYLDHPPSGTDRRVSTPSTTALQITGDLDVRFDVESSDWDSLAGTVELGGKWGAAGQRAWHAYLFAGTVRLGWTTDGTTEVTAAAPVSTTAHTPRTIVRITVDVNNGAGGRTVQFFTGPTMTGPWTQIGVDNVVAGTSATASSTAGMEIGDCANVAFSHVQGRIYAAQMRSGIGGTLVASPDFTAQTVGAGSFTDGSGVPWTANDVTALSNRRTRFVGEISAWPARWDVNGADVCVPVSAAGIMRRLGQGATPLDSALRRSITAAQPLAYWPLEDGQASTQAASGLIGGTPMRVLAGAPSFAATDGPPGSLPLPDFSNGGTLTAALPTNAATSWTIDAVTKFGTSLPEGFSTPLSWTAAGNTAVFWELVAFPVADGGLSLQWSDATFSTLGGPYESNVTVTDGLWHHVRITVAQSGTAISIKLWLDGTLIINFSQGPITLGALRDITINQTREVDAGIPSLGHLAVWEPSTTLPTYLAMNGNDGETAGSRISRLAGEEGVPLRDPYGAAGDTLLGPQRTGTLLDLLQEAADAEVGILYEARDAVALAARPRTSLYNQVPTLALDYEVRGHVAPPLEPTEDDTATRNDVTRSRPSGSSARLTLDSGTLSTQAPPLGVGRYTDSQTVNVHTDDQLIYSAGWALHLGTVDEARYPAVTVNLAAGPALVDAACATDVGDRATIDNPPPWLAPGTIDLQVQGYTETIGWADWTITYNCTPGSPWVVGVLGDGVASLRTAGSTLAAGVNATATTLSVATTAGPLWITTASRPQDFPLDVEIGGEVLRVGAISGTSSPQSFTGVTRSVNGVVKAQATNAPVQVAHPFTVAL